jgi:hypothetical protein
VPAPWRSSAFSLSTSAMSETPPSMRVIATGCAEPMPPSPALTTRRPRRLPAKCSRATWAKVSYVPWSTPWEPMYCQHPAVSPPHAMRLRRSSS